MAREPLFEVVGISYSKVADLAPRISVKGVGVDAKRIVQIAKNAGVPVITDPCLVKSLRALERNQLIPPLLYHAVALIFARLQGS